MTEDQLRTLIRSIVLEVLQDYFKFERDLELSKAEQIERLYQIEPRTSHLRREHRAQQQLEARKVT